MRSGKVAEYVAWCWLNWLKTQGRFIDVLDVRNDLAYREIDVDFVCYLPDGDELKVEVKSDGHLGKTDNILFEVLRINHTAPVDKAVVLGWSTRSQADWFVYFAPGELELYQCKTRDLREAFQKYTQQARENTQRGWVNTDNIKSTLNVYIPWEYCKDIFTRLAFLPEMM